MGMPACRSLVTAAHAPLVRRTTGARTLPWLGNMTLTMVAAATLS